jgi:hypothetical protein
MTVCRRRPPRPDDRGIATATAVVAIGLGLLALVALINFVVYQYGAGAARSAVDQAARTGSRASASEATCEARANEALDTLLGGPMGDDITITCTDNGQHVTATATGTFRGWLPIVPDWSWEITATATKEQDP